MGLAEILVIAVVGLLVVGPERLPQAIKSGMIWMGRVRRMLSDTRAEFEQQLGVDEIRREIHNEQVMASLKALREAQHDLESETERSIEAAKSLEQDFAEDDDGLYGEQRANHPVAEMTDTPPTEPETSPEAPPRS